MSNSENVCHYDCDNAVDIIHILRSSMGVVCGGAVHGAGRIATGIRGLAEKPILEGERIKPQGGDYVAGTFRPSSPLYEIIRSLGQSAQWKG